MKPKRWVIIPILCIFLAGCTTAAPVSKPARLTLPPPQPEINRLYHRPQIHIIGSHDPICRLIRIAIHRAVADSRASLCDVVLDELFQFVWRERQASFPAKTHQEVQELLVLLLCTAGVAGGCRKQTGDRLRSHPPRCGSYEVQPAQPVSDRFT